MGFKVVRFALHPFINLPLTLSPATLTPPSGITCHACAAVDTPRPRVSWLGDAGTAILTVTRSDGDAHLEVGGLLAVVGSHNVDARLAG